MHPIPFCNRLQSSSWVGDYTGPCHGPRAQPAAARALEHPRAGWRQHLAACLPAGPPRFGGPRPLVCCGASLSPMLIRVILYYTVVLDLEPIILLRSIWDALAATLARRTHWHAGCGRMGRPPDAPRRFTSMLPPAVVVVVLVRERRVYRRYYTRTARATASGLIQFGN